MVILMADQLLTLIAGTFGIDVSEVSEASDASNTRRWDSLRQVMLMTELETTYGIELTDRELIETTSVEKIRAVLRSHGKG
jgi:acyl carrier protein